jgi:hypothetical protein
MTPTGRQQRVPDSSGSSARTIADGAGFGKQQSQRHSTAPDLLPGRSAAERRGAGGDGRWRPHRVSTRTLKLTASRKPMNRCWWFTTGAGLGTAADRFAFGGTRVGGGGGLQRGRQELRFCWKTARRVPSKDHNSPAPTSYPHLIPTSCPLPVAVVAGNPVVTVSE